MYGGRLENISICTCMGTSWGSFVWKYEEDGECDSDHTLMIDRAQGGDKEIFSIGEDNWNMCKDDAIETKLMLW